MNLNNLQDLQRELKDFGFNPKVTDELEKNMKALPGHFTLKDQLPGDKGIVDMTLHFHKSGQSDNYAFNKFEVTAGKVPPTIENQHYMVISADKEKPDKFLVKNFESPNEALDFFKKQKGTSELAVGESAEVKQNLASMKDGKLNYVNPDFRQAYFSPAVSQTFYIKDGKGYSATQAANLVQDRTVYRTDMMTKEGDPYKAWVRLDFDTKKDDYGNHKFKQFHHPTYGFDMEKTLNAFKIKELAEPEKKAELIRAFNNGDRVAVTAIGKDGKEAKVMAEVVPRYGKLNFFSEKGAMMKREQFTKTVAVETSQNRSQSQNKAQQQSQSRGIR
ncbi:hypothetical protein BDD43_0165 [Mucilaginibacter gracilis]|uniref:DUF3945 domain-containing protein n=1 Tax=Mucilaginibacter gracilis TaxID=423350 RepID=A0A495IU17_9SPHI|nr:hypothetical protein [Mucilaginibacter gracilis]RKR80072.1 hypothetical protein BDD43_0165 [Mucilaginibacter gracilis]